MTELCASCGVVLATEREWPLCEGCYHLACNEEHEAERADERRVRRSVLPLRTIPDLLLRVMRPHVPSLYLERNGIYRGDCPWCDEDGELAKSLFVYPTNLYHCFACGAAGDVIQFMMVAEGLRFMQAVEWLAKQHGLPLEPPQ